MGQIVEKNRRNKLRAASPGNSRRDEGLVARNVTVNGHRTSLRLEPDLWKALEEICGLERVSVHDICTLVDKRRNGLSRTSAVRVFALTYFRAAARSAGRPSSANILASLPELVAYRQQQQHVSRRVAHLG